MIEFNSGTDAGSEQYILVNTKPTGEIFVRESEIQWQEDETGIFNGVKLKFSHKNASGIQPVNTYGF